MSGVAIQSWVTIGLDTDAYHVIDTGKARRATDVLGKVKNKTAVAAIARFRINWDEGRRFSSAFSQVTNASIVEYFNSHPEIEGYARRAGGVYSATRAPVSVVGGFISLAYEYNPLKAAEFISCVESGEGLLKGHPALEFRNRMVREFGSKARLDRTVVLVLMIKAFNAYLRGDSVGTLKFIDNEKFPEIGR
jgi:hypothetical protein